MKYSRTRGHLNTNNHREIKLIKKSRQLWRTYSEYIKVFYLFFFITVFSESCKKNQDSNRDKVPASPTQLIAATISNRQINLTWTDNAINETGYNIERKKVGDNSYALIDILGADATFYKNVDLTPNTNYSYRVSSYNAAGSSTFSNEVQATTAPEYPSVKIGNQVWMSQNLDVTTYRNGDTIPQVTDPVQWYRTSKGAWCYYNNDPENGKKYGKLYNLHALTDPRGLAPAGWHLPSYNDWRILENALGGRGDAGGKMKAISPLWMPFSPNNPASNSSGFTALPGGLRQFDGKFDKLRFEGYWWSNTNSITLGKWIMILKYSSWNSFIDPSSNIWDNNGFSVRLIKN